MNDWRILTGDCREVLKTLKPCSVDAVVTDPPYELGFMGKRWDRTGIAHQVEIWTEVLRVVKPGAHLLAFGGTRTYHRLVCAIEDAGFEIRDSIHWMYGSGFAKSKDVSKAIEATELTGGSSPKDIADAREKTGQAIKAEGQTHAYRIGESKYGVYRNKPGTRWDTTTDAAKQWEGWGTGLKPAHEIIVVARKSLEGTVAANVQKWGTGGINVDGCRVAFQGDKWKVPKAPRSNLGFRLSEGNEERRAANDLGRWPPNVVLSLEAAAQLDRQSGILQSGDWPKNRNTDKFRNIYQEFAGQESGGRESNSGGASRFFPIFRYEPKAARSERDAGLADDERNAHPTVKPVALMQWLCRLVTPSGGTVLDPFLGSGSTGIAALREGFGFIGIELSPEDVELATRRIEEDAPLFNRVDRVEAKA